MILSAIITVHSLVPKIGIMMVTHHSTVPWLTKAPGGTRVVMTQTSMACTSMVRSVIKE